MSEQTDGSRLGDGRLDRSSADGMHGADAVSEPSYRLLRAIEELRALERERRAVDGTSAEFDEIDRRVERKAREVFQIAEAADDADDPSPLGGL